MVRGEATALARARIEFLARGEKELVHAQSLGCLDEFGVLIRNEEALSLQEVAVAKVVEEEDAIVSRFEKG